MKNRFSFYLLYGLLVLFGGLGAMLLLFGEKTPRPSYSENRMLAGFPAFSLTTIGDGSFMSGLEDYLCDNVPDRDEIVAKTAYVLDRLSFDEKKDPQKEQEELMQAVAEYAQEDEAPTQEPTPEPATPSVPETPAAEPTPEPPASVETPAAEETPSAKPLEPETPQPAPEKDLSGVPECRFTGTQPDGREQTIYTFPQENIRRMIRVLDAYRAVLPQDGHVFFAQPPFPGIAKYLQNGTYTGWGGELEDVINAYCDDGVYAVNVQKVLEQPLLNGEDLYFTTDHHWKPRAACYTVNAILETMGIEPKPYDSYTYETYLDFYGSAAINHPNYKSEHAPDTADIMIPATPVKGYRILWNGTEVDAPLMVDSHSYMAYLGGILGPWRRFDTGVDCERNCLVIGDSYANVLVPYLTPYYASVHLTDVRYENYDPQNAKWTISEYIDRNGIDDVYIILSTASGVNTVVLIESLLRYL